MARYFDTTDSLRCSIGGLSSQTLGGTTFAVIVNIATNGVWRTPIALHSSGGTAQGAIQLSTTNTVVFGHSSDTSASTFTVTAADNWVLIACTKASGTTTPRFHKYVFDTNTWTHQNGDSTLTNGSSVGSGGTVRFGEWQGGDRLQGRLHLAAIFNSELTDAQVENLAAGQTAWFANNPKSLWAFDQSLNTQKVRDQVGTSHESTRTGTSVSGEHYFSWTYGALPVLVTTTAVSTGVAASDSGTLTDSATVTVATVNDVTDSGTLTESARVGTTQAGPRLPSLFVEAGFGGESADNSTYLHLDDPTRGVLDTATLAPTTIWSDITAYLSAGSIRRGSNRSDSPILKYETGTCTLTLRNEDRRFDPTNLAGPYVSYVVAAGDGEIINLNTDFEVDVSHWTQFLGTSFAQDGAQFHSGSFSGKFTPNGTNAGPFVANDWVNFEVDQWYQVSVWVRCAVARTIRAAIHWYDSTPTLVSISDSGAYSVLANTWTHLSFTAQCPEGATQGPMLVWMPGTPSATDFLWIDDAELSLLPRQQVTKVTPMVPVRIRAGWVETEPGYAVQDVGSLPSDTSSLIYYLGSTGVAMNTNPTFEVDASGWSGTNASIARDTSIVYPEQVASLKITPNGSSATGGAVTTPHTAVGTVAPGHTYRASIWAYSPAGWSDLRTSVLWYDSSDTLIQTDLGTQVTVAAATWTQLTDDYVAPPNASRAVMQAYHGGTPAGTDVWYIWNAYLSLTDVPDFKPVVVDDWVSHYDSTGAQYDTGVPRRVTAVTSLGSGYYRIDLSQPLAQTAIAGDYLAGVNLVYDLFQGYADSWDINWDGPNWSEVQLNASDIFKVLANMNIAETGSTGDGDTVGERIDRVLDTVGWAESGRLVDSTDTTVLQGTTFGTDALSELQLATDSGLGELYIDGAGRVYFRGLGATLTDQRSASSQATFGDGGGTELPYLNVEISYDDDQLVNDVTIGRDGGTAQNATDSSSIQRFLRRTFERTDLQMQSDTLALSYAQWLLAQRKDPELRFDSLVIAPLTNDTVMFPQALGREIGDRITVIRRPPGGGDPIERDLYVRGISHDFTPGNWTTTWALQSAQDLSLLTLDDEMLGMLDNDNALGF